MLFRLARETLEYISKVARIMEVLTACIVVASLAPVNEEEDDWISDLRAYIETGTLLGNETRARKQNYMPQDSRCSKGDCTGGHIEGP